MKQSDQPNTALWVVVIIGIISIGVIILMIASGENIIPPKLR